MKSLLVCQHWSGCITLPIPNPHSLDISWWLTIVVERFLVRVALGDHHSHDDVLETWQGKHTGVLHVGQIGFSGRCWIKWNIPIKTKRQGMTFYCVLNCIMCKCCASPFSHIFFFTDHSCEVVMKRAASWPRMIMQVWMKMLPRTGRASRLAGGLQRCSSSLGPPLPITMASKVIRQMSKNRNCRSAMFVFSWKHASRDHMIHWEFFKQ